MENILFIASWIAPPLLGAIIGYGTNRLAIKMLFRPLEPKRFLGRRIPFTPGIIPKSRDDLAASVGSIVAKDLLSPDALHKHLDNPDFRANLAIWLAQQRPSLMGHPLLSRLTGGMAQRIERWAADRAVDYFAAQLPSISRIVNVEELIANRIRDAEVAEVERMILQVSGKHLKWINWLGAMLGFLIGCLQLALRAFL